MLFERYLIPDLIVDRFSHVTPDMLKKMGIVALLCDIDNTLAPYEDEVPSDEVLKWCDEMKNAGIKIAFISNNGKDRVEKFNEALALHAYPEAGKPLLKEMKNAIADLGSDIKNTAFLGDQLFTDTLAAKRLGIPSILVPPIKDKKTMLFRIKRFLERPYIKKYKKIHDTRH